MPTKQKTQADVQKLITSSNEEISKILDKLNALKEKLDKSDIDHLFHTVTYNEVCTTIKLIGAVEHVLETAYISDINTGV